MPSRRSVLGALSTVALSGSTDVAARAASPPPGIAAPTMTVTPEQFGAIGDGTADDAPALQRALDALAARAQGGVLLLQAKTAYRCGTGLVLDASYVSLDGTALLDFSGWEGRYLRVTATSVAHTGEAANNYGHKGKIDGAVRIKGAGQDTRSIGVDFDSPHVATAAQLLVENLSVSACGTGVRFGDRAYNNVLLRCEIFSCGLCVDWPAAQDNGERNALIGCTLHGSGLAVRVTHDSAALQLSHCSLDYTARLYEVTGGSIMASGCHHESDRWADRAIRCAGDGALIRLDACIVVNTAAQWAARTLVDTGRGGTVRFAGTRVHNLSLQPPDASHAASFATGEGAFHVTQSQAVEYSPTPPRLHATRTLLSDPDFRAPGFGDMIWRIRDTTLPIVDRHGGARDNLRLSQATADGETNLSAVKALGPGAAAAFVLIALSVRDGDVVLAGFRVRRDPQRPGADATLDVIPTWMRLDGQDGARVPVVARAESVGTQTVRPASDRYLLVSPMASRVQRTAPPWATHFAMVVDLAKADRAGFLFNGLWADTM